MSNNDSQQIVNKAWDFAHALRDDVHLEDFEEYNYVSSDQRLSTKKKLEQHT